MSVDEVSPGHQAHATGRGIRTVEERSNRIAEALSAQLRRGANCLRSRRGSLPGRDECFPRPSEDCRQHAKYLENVADDDHDHDCLAILQFTVFIGSFGQAVFNRLIRKLPRICMLGCRVDIARNIPVLKRTYPLVWIDTVSLPMGRDVEQVVRMNWLR